ncbi:hypothetical protein [Mycobacterium sp. SMC-19]|uniref:hypothetical protein n=1 Tax=Mycobacterium sp. SMC-19 TaxID=3381630 RepID=UPI0038766201
METQTHTDAAEYIRTSVRLSPPIHRNLRIAALNSGTSVSALIGQALEQALAVSDPATVAAASDSTYTGSWVSVALPAQLHRRLRLAAIDAGVPATAIAAGAVAALTQNL